MLLRKGVKNLEKKGTMNKYSKVAIIILNYKNWQDTIECLESIQKLNYPDYQIIVVDNGSDDDSVEKIKEWTEGKLKVESKFVKYRPDFKPVFYVEYDKETAEKGGVAQYEKKLAEYQSNGKIVLIQTGSNLGFSVGNNVGIRYAIKKNSDAVLIINPDVRLCDPDTLSKMLEVMFSRGDIVVVGPNVIDRDGNRQSPLREPSFFEECTNPFISTIKKKFSNNPVRLVESIKSNKPYKVEKVTGACLMIKTSFLKEIGLLDENVFLYCEEPILMYQVQKHKGTIIFLPFVTVEHLHHAKKENIFQYKEFMKSRLYFLSRYKRYTFWQIALIKVTYSLVLLIKIFKFMR